MNRDAEPLAARADDVDGDLTDAAFGQAVEEPRQLGGYAGPDDHEVGTGEHGPVCRCRRRHLDLLQIVDPDEPIVAFFGEEDLYEVGRHDEVGGEPARVQRQAWHEAEGLVRLDSTLYEIALEDLFGNLGVREAGKRPANMAAVITELKAPCEKCVQGYARNNAELARERDCPREGPSGDADAHTALDDRR